MRLIGALCVAVVAWAGSASAQSSRPPATAATVESPRTVVLRAYERSDYAQVIDRCTAHLTTETDADARALFTYYLGAAYHHLSQPARALALWTQLLADWPESPFAPKALLGLGLAQAAQGEWAASQAACERFLLQASPGPDALVAEYWRAESLARQDRWPEAIAAFRAVLANPTDHALKLDARTGLIHGLAATGDAAGAAAAMRVLADEAPAFPDLARSWVRVAQAARNAGDTALAVTAAQAALDADDRAPLEASLVLAEAALLDGEPLRARLLLRRLLAERGTSATRARLLSDLAWAAYGAREYTQAVAGYQQAAQLYPGALGPWDYLRLGLSYVALRDTRAALDVLAPLQGEPALDAHADSLNTVLVAVGLQAGDAAAALRLLHTGLRAWPASPHGIWRHEQIARILARRGAWVEAAQAYRAASDRAEGALAGAFALRAAGAEARAGRWRAVRRVLPATPTAVPPRDRVLLYALHGDAAAVAGRWAAAARAYRRAADASTVDAVRGVFLVRAARAAASNADAATVDALAAAADPTDETAEVWVLKGALAARAGDMDGARAAWEVAAPFSGSAGAHARLALAWTHLDAGRPDHAIPFLASGAPGSSAPWVQYGMAAAHADLAEFSVAAAEFTNLADEYADTALGRDAALRAADALDRAGTWQEAERAYEQLRDGTQDAATRRAALFGLGWTLADHGLDGPATTTFQAALAEGAAGPDAVEALLWLGRTAFLWGRYAVAEDAFAQALGLEPEAAEQALAEYWLARCLFERRQYVSAAATFAGCRRRVAAAAYEAQIAYWEVRCADALQDAAAVLANAGALRRAFPETDAWVDVDLVVGEAHRRRQDWHAARAAYERAATSADPDVRVRALRGTAACLEATGDFDGAIVALFRIRPGDFADDLVAEARVALGGTLVRAGRAADARTILEDVARQYPETEAARVAAAALVTAVAGPT